MGPLGDNPFHAQFAGLLEHGVSIRLNVLE
jgi:hypothetical protein